MVKNKRDSLERFIYEQIVGPGATGFRYIDLNEEDVLLQPISQQQPINNHHEVLNIVPAGIYSSGILFPIDQSGSDTAQNQPTSLDSDEEGDGDALVEEEDKVQIDQMFPNHMGLTCCLDMKSGPIKDVVIQVQARYYNKLNSNELGFESRYGILCECDKEKLITFIRGSVLENAIVLVERNENTVLLLRRLSAVDMSIAKDALDEQTIVAINDLYPRLPNQNGSVKRNLSAMKQSCFYELQKKYMSDEEQKQVYNVSQSIETIENITAHIKDLFDIFDSRSYGLWQSQLILVNKTFPSGEIGNNFLGKRVFSYKEHSELRDFFIYELPDNKKASLSLNIQLSKSSRRKPDKVFLKAQLVNTSSSFTKDDVDTRYYSVVNDKINQRSFFGVKVKVTSESLCPYNDLDLPEKENFDEDDTIKFLYRQFKDYGIGHGCSVNWGTSQDGERYVQTEYIPACNTPDVEPTPKDKDNVVKIEEHFEPSAFIQDTKGLQFKWLSIFSNSTNKEVVDTLISFVDTYGQWIINKEKKYALSSPSTKTITTQELGKCWADKERMENNIRMFLDEEHMEGNRGNIESFRLMNAAMFMQLWHSVKVKNEQVKEFFSDQFNGFDQVFYTQLDDELQPGARAAWRPFQLAFILLNLDGIFKLEGDRNWEKRNEWVDLVWFPTGGGKTEAYLGIIALTIINRRKLHRENGGGVAAIMRYTLRLLTLQQFQRATLVIMALELIRRWESYGLGKEPIYIGLWVGDDSMPNSMDDLIEEFNKIYKGTRSKVPFDKCPWCGSGLTPALQSCVDKTDVFHFERLHLKCSHRSCSFNYAQPARARLDQGPIPVSLCDEEIYHHPPALLFGTVDKFAQLAHKASHKGDGRNKDSRRIFGRGNWEKGKPALGYLPPDLIIQDELHLLLGPLGSAVALFESAVDQLCRREDGTRPKVISSTATTRNTGLQVMAIFDRRVNIFPKSGVECDDSFFAFYKRKYSGPNQQEEEFISNRRYLGILPTGRTQIWMQMRLAAVLLTHRAIFELEHTIGKDFLTSETYQDIAKAMDYYHTVLSYFNSLKEVGKTESQIHSYILKEIRKVFNKVIRPGKLMHGLYTFSIYKGELTGRLNGEEVKNELEKVTSKWIASKRFAHKQEEQKRTGTTPPDFVVATNMISVGIDVSRFNSILINSMPRNIAEYIQASSRVARESYGLVLTIHHPFRARDMSHYEKFIEFHEKMYSYVEPISITPFTKKAIERYLGLYLATILRHTTQFVNRDSAINIVSEEIPVLVESLVAYFQNRYEHLSSLPVDDLLKNLLKEDNVNVIEEWIRGALEDWLLLKNKVLAEGRTLVFNNALKAKGLLQEGLYVDIDSYEDNIHSTKWQIPMSLRVIEPGAVIKIKSK